VHMLMPGGLAITQDDRYEPEPEPGRGEFRNTWHLTASTVQPAAAARFLTVFLPHRLGKDADLPEVGRLDGEGAVGVRLVFRDGREDIVAFRTDAAAKRVACGGLRSDGRIFALGRAADRTVARRLLLDGKALDIDAPTAATE